MELQSLNNVYSRLYIYGNICLARGDLQSALLAHQEAYEGRKASSDSLFCRAASLHKLGTVLETLGRVEEGRCVLHPDVPVSRPAVDAFPYVTVPSVNMAVCLGLETTCTRPSGS